MREKEKTTVPVPSVGADGEQSLSYVAEEIVAQELVSKNGKIYLYGFDLNKNK